MGQPASITGGFVIPVTAQTFRYYAGWADKIEGQAFPAEGDRLNIVQYEPIGVCAGIGPWNISVAQVLTGNRRSVS
jgi:aldehyde dehydrogenase (NAD+)